MKLAHPMLSLPFKWEEEHVNSFVIENATMYRNFLTELYDQCSGLNGDFVLSNNLELLEISKNIEMVGNVLEIDHNNKKIVSGIVKELTDVAINDLHTEVLELYSKINETISNIIFESGNDIVFDDINDISQLLKLYNVRPDSEDLSLAEKILSYMNLCEKYLGKKLFVFLNIHSYFSKGEMELLFQDFIYRKFNVLLIERYDYQTVKGESKRILDRDLCEI